MTIQLYNRCQQTLQPYAPGIWTSFGRFLHIKRTGKYCITARWNPSTGATRQGLVFRVYQDDSIVLLYPKEKLCGPGSLFTYRGNILMDILRGENYGYCDSFWSFDLEEGKLYVNWNQGDLSWTEGVYKPGIRLLAEGTVARESFTVPRSHYYTTTSRSR